MEYPGGKGSLYQQIINLIPPHQVYIESHLGGGAILRHKRPARQNIGLDLDPAVLEQVRYHLAKNDGAAVELINADATTWLKAYNFQSNEFVYADPPYLLASRRQHRQLYRYEYTRQQHVELLDILTAIPCQVMVSGYWSELYAEKLAGWHTANFEVRTRGGSWATEYLWMNYPPPTQLHDYSFLGSDYRERERIKRKKARWVKRLNQTDLLERQAILAAIEDIANLDEGGHYRQV